MKSNLKMVILSIIFVIFLITSFIVLPPKNTNVNDQILNLNDYVLYFGETCPFCKELEKFLIDNNLKEKLNLVEKEIYYNQKNLEEFKSVAKICNLNLNELGVPFMWAKGECLMGYDKILEYLRNNFLNTSTLNING